MQIEDYGIWIGRHNSGQEPVIWQHLNEPLPYAGRYVLINNGIIFAESQGGFKGHRVWAHNLKLHGSSSPGHVVKMDGEDMKFTLYRAFSKELTLAYDHFQETDFLQLALELQEELDAVWNKIVDQMRNQLNVSDSQFNAIIRAL